MWPREQGAILPLPGPTLPTPHPVNTWVGMLVCPVPGLDRLQPIVIQGPPAAQVGVGLRLLGHPSILLLQTQQLAPDGTTVVINSHQQVKREDEMGGRERIGEGRGK